MIGAFIGMFLILGLFLALVAIAAVVTSDDKEGKR